MVALDQLNSLINGVKNTPKLLLIPQTMAWIKKEAGMMV